MNRCWKSVLKAPAIIMILGLLMGLIAVDSWAQARRAKIPYEYPKFDGTNLVELFDGKTLTGWIPLEMGGGGPVEVVEEFVPSNSPEMEPSNVIMLNRGDMMTGISWTNGPARMNYEIEWEAMRVDGNDFFAAMSFPVQDSYVTFIPAGWGGSVVGISSINGHDASENETSRYHPLETQKWHQFKVRVTEKKVEAWINGEKVVNLNTVGKTLGLRSGSPSEIKRYGIVCTAYCSTGAIKKIRMRKIDPQEVIQEEAVAQANREAKKAAHAAEKEEKTPSKE